jgi:AbiV family abortive infection protein
MRSGDPRALRHEVWPILSHENPRPWPLSSMSMNEYLKAFKESGPTACASYISSRVPFFSGKGRGNGVQQDVASRVQLRMGKPRLQELTSDQCMALATKLFSNADDLLIDAQTLLGHERFPRAFSLAVLAAEEFIKAHLFVGVALRLVIKPAEKPDWLALSQLFYSHGQKLGLAFLLMKQGPQKLVDMPPTAISWAIDMANRFDKRKQDGFYVNWSRTGPQAPQERISEELARNAIQIVLDFRAARIPLADAVVDNLPSTD